MATYKEAADALAAALESGNAEAGQNASAIYAAAVAENEVEDYVPGDILDESFGAGDTGDGSSSPDAPDA